MSISPASAVISLRRGSANCFLISLSSTAMSLLILSLSARRGEEVDDLGDDVGVVALDFFALQGGEAGETQVEDGFCLRRGELVFDGFAAAFYEAAGGGVFGTDEGGVGETGEHVGDGLGTPTTGEEGGFGGGGGGGGFDEVDDSVNIGDGGGVAFQ